MNQDEKIKNLYYNIYYIIEGIESGWLDIKNSKIVELCYFIKTLSDFSPSELFSWENGKEVCIKLK